MKNYLNSLKNKEGMGLLAVLMAASIGIIILTGFSLFINKSIDGISKRQKITNFLNGQDNVLGILRSYKAWNATLNLAGACFPGSESGGVPCKVFHVYDPFNNPDVADYNTNAKRWVVPILNNDHGVALMSEFGEILFSDGCNDPDYATITAYESCMQSLGYKNYTIIKIAKPASGFATDSAEIPNFLVTFIDTRHTKNVYTMSLDPLENLPYLGFAAGQGWSSIQSCRVSIGQGVNVTENCSVGIGNNAVGPVDVSGQNAIALGQNIEVTGNRAIAIGRRTVAIGDIIEAKGNDSIVLFGVVAEHDDTIAIGPSVDAWGPASIAIGTSVQTHPAAENSIAIGYGGSSYTGELDAHTNTQHPNQIQIGLVRPGFVHVGNPTFSSTSENTLSSVSLYADKIYAENIHHCPGGTNCVLLADYVFDYYFDGIIKKEDQLLAQKHKHLLFVKGEKVIEDLIDFVKTKRHLPAFPGKNDNVAKEQYSIGNILNNSLVSIELKILYFKELLDEKKSMDQYYENINQKILFLEGSVLGINEETKNLEKSFIKLRTSFKEEISSSLEQIENLENKINFLKNNHRLKR